MRVFILKGVTRHPPRHPLVIRKTDVTSVNITHRRLIVVYFRCEYAFSRLLCLEERKRCYSTNK
jgi:hypothetical protein